MDTDTTTNDGIQGVTLPSAVTDQPQSETLVTMSTAPTNPISDATTTAAAPNASQPLGVSTEGNVNPGEETMECSSVGPVTNQSSGPITSTVMTAVTPMEIEKDANLPSQVDPKTMPADDGSFAQQQQQLAMPLPPKEDKIEMIMPKTPSEGSVKSISPSSNSSGSRSRKSSLSSKSPKAHSPGNVASPGSQGRPRKARPPPPIKDDHDGRNDFYCWICHREGEVLCCELCPRVFHAKCLHMEKEPEGDWYCPECEKVMEAECKETQSRAMSQLSIDQLALHLRYALQRMKTTGCEPFLEPVDTKKFNDYLDYVFHPMDLSTLEKNVKKRKYGCTEAFLSDVKWIVHNCVIYNGLQTKLTQIAKSIVKICQHEMSEIEVCPECYLNSCRKRENWFCEPCKEPHLLVWAKLQGFPHWPAKALRIDKGMVDARFFGQHDRAWIPLSGCYLMSKEMPFPVKNKKKGRGPGAKGGLDSAMVEAQHYIDNVSRKLGTFEYAPLRTPLTHMDLYRRSSGMPTPGNPTDSVVIKKEAIEEESKSSLLTSGDRVLNLKIAGSDLKESLEGTTPSPSKKKSKIVTTSGAHPGGKQKGKFGSKKQAPLLEKTIASLRDSITNSDDDSSSDESDSSSDASIEDTPSSNKSTPNSVAKGADEAEQAAKSKASKKDHSDESDTELVMDIPDDEDAKKTDEKGTSQKGVIKSKKSDGEKSTKPKSILLNKDPGKITDTPARPLLGGGSIKRKMNEESTSTVVKSRKVEGMTKPSDSGGLKDGKALKEKKKLPGDAGRHISEKLKRNPETLVKSKKDGSLVGVKKLTNPEATRKKIMMTDLPKTKPPEDRTNLKSAAKILSQKVMSRKTAVHPSEKQKSLDRLSGDKGKESVAYPDSSKRLSSFTIPKHKPTARATEEPVRTNTVTTKNTAESNDKAPSTNGSFPIQKIDKYNDKVMIGVRQVLVEMYEDMMSTFEHRPKDSLAAAKDSEVSHQVHQLQLELDRLKWMHQQEIAELQHNHDLTIAEIRQSLENEKLHLLDEARRKSEAEKLKAIEETKQKQWCANCGKEAIFYCCWNTSYCDYPCQQLHWPKHMATCSQARDAGPAAAASSATTASQHSNPFKTKESDAPADTPTSPMDLVPSEKEIESKSVVEEEKSTVEAVVDDDDDESDNEMMVIDESLHKEDEAEQDEKDKPSELQKSAKSPAAKVNDEKQEVSCSGVETHSKSPPSDAIAPSTPSTSVEKTAIIPSVVSTLASDIKPKPLLPVKAPSSSSSSVHGTVGTTVVSSKLLDDIFKKENDEAGDKSPEKDNAEHKHETEKTDIASNVPEKPAKEPMKTHSGNAISAIGDRLMKARQQLEELNKTEMDVTDPDEMENKKIDDESNTEAQSCSIQEESATKLPDKEVVNEGDHKGTASETCDDAKATVVEKMETEDEETMQLDEKKLDNVTKIEDGDQEKKVQEAMQITETKTAIGNADTDNQNIHDGLAKVTDTSPKQQQSLETEPVESPKHTETVAQVATSLEEAEVPKKVEENDPKPSAVSLPPEEKPQKSPEVQLPQIEGTTPEIGDQDASIVETSEPADEPVEKPPGPVFSDSYLSSLTKSKTTATTSNEACNEATKTDDREEDEEL